MEVNFGDEYIQIADGDNDEFLYWTVEEWIEDPQVVFSIANAVMLAVTDPEALRQLIREEVEIEHGKT